MGDVLVLAGLAGLALFGAGLLALYWLQGRFIYPAERLIAGQTMDPDARFVWLSVRTADGLGLACRYSSPPAKAGLRVLLFHGNGEDLRQRSFIAEQLA